PDRRTRGPRASAPPPEPGPHGTAGTCPPTAGRQAAQAHRAGTTAPPGCGSSPARPLRWLRRRRRAWSNHPNGRASGRPRALREVPGAQHLRERREMLLERGGGIVHLDLPADLALDDDDLPKLVASPPTLRGDLNVPLLRGAPADGRRGRLTGRQTRLLVLLAHGGGEVAQLRVRGQIHGGHQ